MHSLALIQCAAWLLISQFIVGEMNFSSDPIHRCFHQHNGIIIGEAVQ